MLPDGVAMNIINLRSFHNVAAPCWAESDAERQSNGRIFANANKPAVGK